MDTQIVDVALELSVTDEDALLNPRVMMRILAAVRRQREEDDRLNAQRGNDTSPNARGAR